MPELVRTPVIGLDDREVGLGASSTPHSAAMTVRAKVVLPAPSSPFRNTVSPRRSALASRRASALVAARSGKETVFKFPMDCA